MDNKRNIFGLVVVIGLSMLWLMVVWPWLAKKNHWINDHPLPTASTTTTPGQVATAPATTRATTNPVEEETARLNGRHAEGGIAVKQMVTLGSVAYSDEKNPGSPYPMGLTLSSRGASVQAVTLNRYHEAVDRPAPYVFQKPIPLDSPFSTALATRWVEIDGSPAIQLDTLDWKLTSGATSGPAIASKASFVADIKDAATPLIRVTKTYEIRPAIDKTAGYEVLVTYAIDNRSATVHHVRFGFNGPNPPHTENNRDIPELVAGFDGERENVVVEHSAAASVKQAEPLDLKTMKKAAKLLWSGIASSYFDALVRPTDAAGNSLALDKALAHMLALVTKDADSVAIEYETGDIVVPAKGSNSFALNVYFGPKLRQILTNEYYTAFPLGYDGTLILRGGCYSLCTWAWMINLLVGLLKGFHFLLRDWGLAIIGLVLLVRLILHPITKSSQISMSRMSKLGPEMERLKKKYGDDTEGLKKAQVEFYREQGVAPFLGCLPMFLQMPIWIALWSSLQSTFEIRHAPFLQIAGHHLTWIHDLAQPDRLIVFKEPISLFFFHIEALNLLPILMGVVFYINQKFMPQPMAIKPEQAQQQKMMKWMSVLMFPIFLYTSPSGLNLYIFTSTLIGIFESKRIRAHIQEKEEREKSGVVIVDEPPGRGPAKKAKTGGSIGGGIASFFAKMQQMAEEAKREQEKQKNKKNR